MILADANLLLYAYDSQSPYHEKAKSWMEDAFSRPEPFGFSWFTLTAFIRIATNPRVFQHPLSSAGTIAIVDESFAATNTARTTKRKTRESTAPKQVIRGGQEEHIEPLTQGSASGVLPLTCFGLHSVARAGLPKEAAAYCRCSSPKRYNLQTSP